LMIKHGIIGFGSKPKFIENVLLITFFRAVLFLRLSLTANSHVIAHIGSASFIRFTIGSLTSSINLMSCRLTRRAIELEPVAFSVISVELVGLFGCVAASAEF